MDAITARNFWFFSLPQQFRTSTQFSPVTVHTPRSLLSAVLAPSVFYASNLTTLEVHNVMTTFFAWERRPGRTVSEAPPRSPTAAVSQFSRLLHRFSKFSTCPFFFAPVVHHRLALNCSAYRDAGHRNIATQESIAVLGLNQNPAYTEFSQLL